MTSDILQHIRKLMTDKNFKEDDPFQPYIRGLTM